LDNPSEILNSKQLREMHSHLPYFFQYKNWKLCYSITKMGINMKTFFSKAEGFKQSILVMKDDDNNVMKL